jgi:hypothetical protein
MRPPFLLLIVELSHFDFFARTDFAGVFFLEGGFAGAFLAALFFTFAGDALVAVLLAGLVLREAVLWARALAIFDLSTALSAATLMVVADLRNRSSP